MSDDKAYEITLGDWSSDVCSSDLTTTGFYLSTGYKDVPGLVLLLIVLAVRPQGLLDRKSVV